MTPTTMASTEKKSPARLSTLRIWRPGLLGLALSGLALASIGCSGVSASVGVRGVRPGVEIRVQNGPPAPRIEHIRMEAPSRRHVWVDGFWDWSPRRGDWQWVEGGWYLPPRGRNRWVPPAYRQRGEGWIVIRGHWN